MTDSRHISQEDLALYAMQALSLPETAEAAAHFATCPECTHELGLINGDLALLALSVEEQPVPAEARDRFMSRIATAAQAITPAKSVAPAQPASLAQPISPTQPISIDTTRARPARTRSGVGALLLPWATAAAMFAAAAYLGVQNQDLHQRLNQQAGQLAVLDARAAQAQQVLDTLTSESARRVTLTSGKGTPEPTGRAAYLADRGALVFIANNLHPLPAKKVYELWIIPANGKAPIPAGLFHPDQFGSASVVMPKLPVGVEAKAFGVTIEDEAGSATPTMPIVLSGQ